MRIFKGTFFIVLSCSVLGAVVICLFGFELFVGGKKIFPLLGIYLHPIFCFILILTWIVLCFYVFILVYKAKIESIDEYLYTLCDPKTFLDIWLGLKKNRKWEKTNIIILFNICIGYLYSGQTDSAKQVLDSVKVIIDNDSAKQARNSIKVKNKKVNNKTDWTEQEYIKSKNTDKILYYKNLSTYYLFKKDIQNAEVALRDFSYMLTNSMTFRQEADTDSYLRNKFLLEMKKGNFEGAEALFTAMFEKAYKMSDKAEAKFILGKIYLHYNKIEQAKDALDFAIEYGGTFYFVNEAKKMLEGLA